ncbi:MAG: hypothetical protein ACYCQI_02570 [Gammaproteobacteria bacterium]
MLSHEVRLPSEFKIPTITKANLQEVMERYITQLSCFARPSDDYLKLRNFINDLKDKDLTKERVLSAEALIRLFKLVNTTLKKTDLKSMVLFSQIKDFYGAQFYLALQVYFEIYGSISLQAFNILINTKKDPVVAAKAMATEIFDSVRENRYSAKFCEECIPYFFGEDKQNADSLETLIKFCNEFKLSDEQMRVFAKNCPEGGVHKIYKILANPDLVNCSQVFGSKLILMCIQSENILSLLEAIQLRLEVNISKLRYRLCSVSLLETKTRDEFKSNFQFVIAAVANNPEKMESIIDLGMNLLKCDLNLEPQYTLYQKGFYKKYTPKYLTKENFEYLLKVKDAEFYDQETLDEILEIQKSSAKLKEAECIPEYKKALEIS